MSSETQARRNRVTLLLVAALFVAPFVAAGLAYLLESPGKGTNYGELLDPRGLSDVALRLPDGASFRLAQLRGKWVMVQIDSGKCDAYCRRKLYLMRQVRKTQGEDMDRIERAWLIDDGVPPAASTVVEYEGTRVIETSGRKLTGDFPAMGSVRDHIYLIDPLGNLMMRFPRDPDPNGMVKDITHLLKVSRIG